MRITGINTQAKTSASDDFEDVDGATNGSRKIAVQDKHGQFRNGLARRGGITGDGSSGQGAISPLGSAGAIGTSAFALSFWYRVQQSSNAVTQVPVYLGSSSTTADAANSIYPGQQPNGNLDFSLYGATTADYNLAHLDLSAFFGKWIHVIFVRNAAGNPTAYMNGVATTMSFATGGTPPTWQGSLTTTYLGLGRGASAYPIKNGTCISDVAVYNLAPSAAEALEIFESGGAIPERYKFGSQSARYTSDFSAGVDGWVSISSNVTGNVDGVSDGTTSKDNTLKVELTTPNGRATKAIITAGKSYRLTLSAYMPAANTSWVTLSVADSTDVFTSLISATSLSHWTDVSGTFTVPLGSSGTLLLTGLGYPTTTGDILYVKDVVLTQLGAIVHFPLDDGLGLQLQDASSNRLHALMTTTGISHLIPFAGPVPLSGTTSTNGNQQLKGAACIPIGIDVEVWAKSESGTPTIDVGNASGGAQIVSAAALTTAWKKLTIVAGGNVTTTTSIWIKSNSVDVVDVVIMQKDIRL